MRQRTFSQFLIVRREETRDKTPELDAVVVLNSYA